ncbi:MULTISPECIES: 5-carboxymethyl-2-hydroxymuconate Delta-isomerase [unclassified Roseovarius]|uniref:5-carboxymethyl-2-hydroxymuconate Delta-isomerase n=1 Tax=unclassified Roseovarius TaxID=2614913 RepID=UPI00273EF1CF|nr:5-carboxymethyl-2-hydroxymuconate Delta-isomerase [Roseovarius sp. MMSF_3350]
MPHIIIEHSRGLEDSHDLQALCDDLWQKFANHPSVTSPDTVRTRTIAATASRIGVEPQSFAHATLLLLPGRSDETRAELAQIVLDTLDSHLPDVGSLTVRLDDIHQPYMKRML